MADTDIDAVKEQKKAEYNKQYWLKRKLLLQASTSTETELAEKQKKTEYDKQKWTYTFHLYWWKYRIIYMS
jgi:hypothetical protein